MFYRFSTASRHGLRVPTRITPLFPPAHYRTSSFLLSHSQSARYFSSDVPKSKPGGLGAPLIPKLPMFMQSRSNSTMASRKLKKIRKKLSIMEEMTYFHSKPVTGYDDHDSLQNIKSSKKAHMQVTMKQMMEQLVPEVKLLSVAMGGLLASSMAALAFPTAIGNIIDIIAASDSSNINESMAELSLIGAYFFGLISVGAVGAFAHTTALGLVGQRIGRDLRKRLYRVIVLQDALFFDRNKTAEIVNRLAIDVHEVAEHLVETGSDFLQGFVQAAMSIGFLVWLSPSLTLTACVVVPVICGGAIIYGRIVRKLSKEYLDTLAESTHLAHESFGAIRTVHSNVAEDRHIRSYTKVIDKSYVLAKLVSITEGAFHAGSFFVSQSALMMVMVIGGNMVLNGTITAGGLTSFCMYALTLSASTGEMVESAGGFIKAQGAGARLFNLLNRESELQPNPVASLRPIPVASVTVDNFLPTVLSQKARQAEKEAEYEPIEEYAKAAVDPDGVILPEIKGELRFENVTFAYPTRPTQRILNGCSFTIKPGETVGIAGTSGSGKSTLAALLELFYRPDSGTIYLDGVPLSSLRPEWLRYEVGVMPQQVMIFTGTVMDNIRYSKPDATDAEVLEAAKAADAHNFIEEVLPAGYETVIGERGLALSGGQKQRIGVARVLLSRPSFLILDEATSSLDKTTQQYVQAGLKEQYRGQTTLVIAHRASVLKEMDRVLVLDQGKIVQSGTYEELLQQGGTFGRVVVGSPDSNPAIATTATD